MRVPAALLVLAVGLPVPGLAASIAAVPPGHPGANCARTRSYLAEARSIYRGERPAPRKLNQLPPGTSYMAVYRRIDGCEVPLTMVEYRSPLRH